MKDLNALGNIQIEKDYVLFSINPSIYPLENIKSVSRKLMKDACIMLDGDKDEILVEIRKRKDVTLKKLAEKFNDLLLKC